MLLLTAAATLLCDHVARVSTPPSQQWVTIEGVPVLVHPDPEGQAIAACPYTVSGKKCTSTFDGRVMPAAVVAGYSSLVRIDGEPVCRHDPFVGLTDGMPVGAVRYRSVNAGQTLVSEGGA